MPYLKLERVPFTTETHAQHQVYEHTWSAQGTAMSLPKVNARECSSVTVTFTTKELCHSLWHGNDQQQGICGILGQRKNISLFWRHLPKLHPHEQNNDVYT